MGRNLGRHLKRSEVIRTEIQVLHNKEHIELVGLAKPLVSVIRDALMPGGSRDESDSTSRKDSLEGRQTTRQTQHFIRGAPHGGMTGPLRRVDVCVLKTRKKKTGKFPRRIW